LFWKTRPTISPFTSTVAISLPFVFSTLTVS